jgi:hypothetical protein
LQLNFTPTANLISFQFVFGSEEYNEFVNQAFNDVFAFFLNGQNIALLPGTNTPITINNVNLSSNSQYYRDNTILPLLNTQLDGLVGVTINLFATGLVNPGVVNTLRIAIADTADRQYDSAVFIGANTFINAPPPDASAVPLPAPLFAGLALIGVVGSWRSKRRHRPACC